jgi:hypothetical protein
MIKVFHLNQLTREERNRLNGSEGGWDSEPRFGRYATITTGYNKEKLLKNVSFALSAGEYHAAANVDTTNLDAAFELTNHISEDWANNDRVEALTEKRKSSSVGDVFAVDRGHYTDWFVVAPMGFDKLEGFDESEIGSLKGLI